MRSFFTVFSLLTMIFFTSTAMAQDANIQWKDLSAGERQGILNQWRALPQGEKGPFMTYRTQAIKDLSDDKKTMYSDVAKVRAEKEKKLHTAYEKRQAVEKKAQDTKKEIEEARQAAEPVIEAPEPIVTESKDVKPIKPVEAVPISNAEPAINAEGVIPVEPVPAAEKAKDMLKKFF